MSIEVYTWLLKGVAALAIAAGIFAFGYRTCENKLQPEINTLTAKLEALDVIAKANEVKQKEIANVIKNKDAEYRAAVDDYYRGLLPKTPDSDGSSKTSADSEGMGAGLAGQTISGCPPEAELKFLNDVRVREGMKEFFIRHNFPTED